MVDQRFPRRYNANLRHGRFAEFSSETVPYNGVDVPQSFTWIAENPHWPAGMAVQMTVRMDPDCGPLPVAVASVGTRHVDVRDALNLLRESGELDQMVEGLVGTAAAALAFARATGGKDGPDALPSDAGSRYWGTTAPRDDRAKAPRRHRMTDDLLANVTRVYRAAVSAGDPPTVAVGEHFGVPYSTAGRWVTVARRRGHLGAAVGPVAGEA